MDPSGRFAWWFRITIAVFLVLFGAAMLIYESNSPFRDPWTIFAMACILVLGILGFVGVYRQGWRR